MSNNASPDLGTACPPKRYIGLFASRIVQKSRRHGRQPRDGAGLAEITGFPELFAADHSVTEIDQWEQAHFDEEEMRNTVKAAKEKYEDALRENFFGF
jgi:hypothetical protein